MEFFFLTDINVIVAMINYLCTEVTCKNRPRARSHNRLQREGH